MTPREMAEENLRKLCAVTGASYSPDHTSFSPLKDPSYPGPWVRIELSGDVYYISAGYVQRTKAGIDPQLFVQGTHTCYYVFAPSSLPIPNAESVASALLLLHHDPKIYERWSERDGPHS